MEKWGRATDILIERSSDETNESQNQKIGFEEE